MTTIKRVARLVALEICEATGRQRTEWVYPDDFVGDVIERANLCARAIVNAMRDPTERMRISGIGQMPEDYNHAILVWEAMIDTALVEGE